MASTTYGGWDSNVQTRKYLYGLADIRADKKGNLQVRLLADKDAKPPRLQPVTFEIAAEDVKAVLPKPGQWFVCVSEKGDRLVSISPPQDGRYTLRYKEMPHAEDAVPEPRVDEGGLREWTDKKTGKKKKAVFDPSMTFTVIVEVADGPYAGSTGRLRVPYAFSNNDRTGYARLDGTPKQVEQLGAFLTVSGAVDPLPFSDNLLPDLDSVLKELAESGHVFTGKINGGRTYDLEPVMGVGKAKKPAAAKKPAKAKARK